MYTPPHVDASSYVYAQRWLDHDAALRLYIEPTAIEAIDHRLDRTAAALMHDIAPIQLPLSMRNVTTTAMMSSVRMPAANNCAIRATIIFHVALNQST